MNKIFNTQLGKIVRTEARLMVEGEFAWLNEFLPEGQGLETFDLMTAAVGIFEATEAENAYVAKARKLCEAVGTRGALVLAAGMASGCDVTPLMASGAVLGLALQNNPDLAAEMMATVEAILGQVSEEEKAVCEALNARFGEFVSVQINAAACSTVH